MKFKKMISNAASVYIVTYPDGRTMEIVITDNCHSGRNTIDILKAFVDLGCNIKMGEQGFIDESGIFHDRAESYRIAKASGQLFNDDYTLPGNRLDSSCIRHFPE